MPKKAFWNTTIETMPLDEMRALQFKKFRKMFAYTYDNNEFYRRKFEKAGVAPADIKSFDDIAKVPVMTKGELREVYPFGLIIAPRDKWVELHSSSGTTGKPVVNVYTAHDLAVWQEVMARNLWAGGLRPGDRLQNAYGLGLFTGGFGFAHGALKIGALMIPTSSGNTKRQIRLALDFEATALAATPSYGLYLAEKAAEMGYDTRKDFSFKAGFFGAEAWSEEIRDRLEDVWGEGFQARESYGLTEVGGPGTSYDCQYKNGLHINSDHFLVECVDKDMMPVAPGEKGELVITTLDREGFPAIRFRTKDLSYLIEEKCQCGRTLCRHARIMGRTDDMMKVKGVIVFPKQIEEAILAVDGVSENYLIEKHKDGLITSLKIKVEPTPARFASGDHRTLARAVVEEITNIVGLKLPVEIVAPGTIPRSEGKAKRVVDLTK